MSGQVFLSCTSTKQRIACHAQGLNAVPQVKLKPATPQYPVKHFTTEPILSLKINFVLANSSEPNEMPHLGVSDLLRVKNVIASGSDIIPMLLK